MHSPRGISLLFFILLLGVASFVYYPRHHAELARQDKLTAILAAAKNPTPLLARTKDAGCAVRGPLPDENCTPGALISGVPLEKMCVVGYSKTVRNVPLKLRKSVFAAYNIAYPVPRGSYELDHLIPLALGGSNDAANLFPEAAAPVPGFKEKDVVEIYLHDEVCAGRADLTAAQETIAHNWLDIYYNLTPDEIAQIRAKYRSWSN